MGRAQPGDRQDRRHSCSSTAGSAPRPPNDPIEHGQPRHRRGHGQRPTTATIRRSTTRSGPCGTAACRPRPRCRSGAPVAAASKPLSPAAGGRRGARAPIGARHIVVGHTPDLKGITILYGGKLARIDTGISRHYDGPLTLARDRRRDHDPAQRAGDRAMMRRLAAVLLLALPPSPPAAARRPSPCSPATRRCRITIEAPFERLFARPRLRRSRSPASLTDPRGNRLPITVELARASPGGPRTSAPSRRSRVRFTAPPPATSPFAGAEEAQARHPLPQAPRRSTASSCSNMPPTGCIQSLTPRSFGARLATIDYRRRRAAARSPPAPASSSRIWTMSRRATALPSSAPARASRPPTSSPRRCGALRPVPAHDRQPRLVDARRAGGRQLLPQCQADRHAGARARRSRSPTISIFRASSTRLMRPRPNSSKLSSVRERKYRGYCVHNAAGRRRRRG